ncbi:PP2C family protein-serine/threonine phosphatase [Streptomyces sp. NPDC003374]
MLGLYARSVEGALGTTAVKVIVDTRSCLITYSSAGHHPPPVLVHRDGSLQLLDAATDPPPAARPVHVPRPRSGIHCRRGDTLVLCTDGLIERRGEDVDVGLERLARTVGDCALLGSEQIAGTLPARPGVAGGGRDDLALIVARLCPGPGRRGGRLSARGSRRSSPAA